MYRFTVPENKRVRVIVSSDTACEADDPFAIAHALLSPKLEVKAETKRCFDALLPAIQSVGQKLQAAQEEAQKKAEEERQKEKMKSNSSGLTGGNGIKSARLHEKNPKKVVLTYENGREQIMDLSLAVQRGYVKN